MTNIREQIKIAHFAKNYSSLLIALNQYCEKETGQIFTIFPSQQDFKEDLEIFHDWLQWDVMDHYGYDPFIKTLLFNYDLCLPDTQENIAAAASDISKGATKKNFNSTCADYFSTPLDDWYRKSPENEQGTVLNIGWPAYIAFMLKKSKPLIKGFKVLLGPYSDDTMNTIF